jgi:streptogramin lyase
LFGNGIGQITPAGAVTEFAVPADFSTPRGITAGPDGNLWFTGYYSGRIGRITPRGVITQFVEGLTPNSSPDTITVGPDGNLWFTEFAANKIGRISPLGVVKEFDVPTAASSPSGITAGPDGNLWFTEFTGNKIGRITPAGVITEYALPSPPAPLTSSGPMGIAAGPDGNLWFAESYGNKIGRVVLPQATPAPPVPADPPAPPDTATLIKRLMASIESFRLKGGIETSLNAKLRHALAAVTSGRSDYAVACNALHAFANEVRAQSGKHLTSERTNQLLPAAAEIWARAGCAS